MSLIAVRATTIKINNKAVPPFVGRETEQSKVENGGNIVPSSIQFLFFMTAFSVPTLR